MNQFEKDYYEYDGFWNDEEKSLKNNIEKIELTLSFIKEDVESVLDAACGNGIFTNYLQRTRSNLKIVGFDRSEQALKYVKTEKFLASIDSIPLSDDSYDCVIAHDVIEHLPVEAYDKALSELSRVAKKYIIIGVPYKEEIARNVTQCPSCFSLFNYDLHLRSFDDDKLKQLFTSYGFDNLSISTCDTVTYYKGQHLYTRYFHPDIFFKFRSPICPVCGYKNKEMNNSAPISTQNEKPVHKKNIGLKNIIRSLWPKVSFDYEVVALYKKNKG